MSLTSNAAPDELSSPYYANNQAICQKWEQYIQSKDGRFKGVYNAWSFAIRAEISSKRNWTIDVKKATYSNGNLFLSSKYMNLQETLIFKSLFEDNDCPSFCITKSFFKRKKRDHPFYMRVSNLLQKEINDQSLYIAEFKKHELSIVIHSKNDGFDVADRILGFEE